MYIDAICFHDERLFLVLCNFKIGLSFQMDDTFGLPIMGIVSKRSPGAKTDTGSVGQHHDIRFENTEVWVVLTGSEEAGLRGAKAFCKAHKDELGDVETVFVGLDTIRDYDFMAIYSRDLTGTVKNDESACALVKEAAKQNGLDMPYKSVFFGATDAAAVTQSGMKAVSIAAMDPAPARYYHTRLDTADNLDIKTIEAVLGVALETAFLFDEKGLSN